MSLHLRSAATVVLVSVLALAGCASPAPISPSNDSPDEFPVTISHAHGETTILAAPERVVVQGSSAEDAVAALGVVPVAVPHEYGTTDGYTEWFTDYVTGELGADLPPVLTADGDGSYDPEEVLSYAPDVIFAPYSGMTEAEYKQFSDIAPTIPYAQTPWTYGGWSDVVQLAGTVLGRSDRARELIAQTTDTISAAADDHPQLAGRSFIFGEWVEDGMTDLAVYSPEDPRTNLLRGFGMIDAPSVNEAVGTFADQYYGYVSLENVDTLSTDVYVGWANSPEKIDQTLANPLMARWAPIAEGRYFYVQDPPLLAAITVPSVLSVPWAIDQGLLDDLSSAVAGTPAVRAASGSAE
ncbi:iron complex transport system substrate-binding protein [Microbacterium proteolyticum]|nr:iron complex transport system substrate-binding protein [Microbacterium sp. SORGH_AS_0344]MDQ1169103.1 iron complex transport system substrate-binding protein [Microbacterium proteolyticum]